MPPKTAGRHASSKNVDLGHGMVYSYLNLKQGKGHCQDAVALGANMTPRRWLTPTSWVYILAHIALFLLGFALVRGVGVVSQGVGASLIAAALTGWVIFVYVRLSERRAEALEILDRFGFVAAFEARAARIKPEYDQRLAGANERIDIMGFGLKALWEDYHDQFPDWKRRVRVRILLMDPNSPCADQRDTEESEIPGSIRSSVRRFLRETDGLRAETAGYPFEIRLYTCLPSVNIFRIDDEMFWGPYLIRAQSRNAPTFVVRHGGILYRRLLSHFEEIWNDDNLSRPVLAGDTRD